MSAWGRKARGCEGVSVKLFHLLCVMSRHDVRKTKKIINRKRLTYAGCTVDTSFLEGAG
jgi:hypothetical protein